jgi:copper(I)-binding protein
MMAGVWRNRRVAIGIGLAALAGIACITLAGAAPVNIAVAGAWALADPKTPDLGYAYMTVSLPKGVVDTLLGATTPLAETIDIVAPAGPAGHERLAVVPSLPIDGHAPLIMQTRGPHLVLHQLTAPLKRGDSFVVTLHFRKAGAFEVAVKVVDAPPDLGMPKLPKGVTLD